jgi:CBS domain-containing protein
MTPEVVTVGADDAVKSVAEILGSRGFAAVPVVGEDGALLGIVAEADVLRDRLPHDPRLRLRRDPDDAAGPPPVEVRGVMTSPVRTVDAGDDVADIARLFVDERIRSVPVLDRGRVVGIVSRRDLLRTLVRPDEQLRSDLLRLLEEYTGSTGEWEVAVADGLATVRRTGGSPDGSAGTEEGAIRALSRTVSGIIGVQVLQAAPEGRS